MNRKWQGVACCGGSRHRALARHYEAESARPSSVIAPPIWSAGTSVVMPGWAKITASGQRRILHRGRGGYSERLRTVNWTHARDTLELAGRSGCDDRSPLAAQL